MPEKRGYVAGKYGLEIDKSAAGWVKAVEGGNASSDVIVEKIAADHLQKKHIGNVKYDDITINCGTGMSNAFYQWIADSMANKFSRKDGAVHACDFNGDIMQTLNWHMGLISEFGLPALDAASKDMATMAIKISPEITRFQFAPGGKGGLDKFQIGKGEQKKWTPANFRLTISGLEEACKKVSKIEACVWKQKTVENPIGEMRDYEKEPAHLEVPNLVVTFVESHAKQVYDWHKSFIIDGNCGEDQEKTATLEYLTPDLKTVLFTVNFINLGIFKMTPDKLEAGSENIRRLKAEMYCEHADFKFGSGSTFM